MPKVKNIDTNNNVFSIRLSELMESHPDVTQQQIADYLGVTRQSVSQYVNGNSQPTADKIILLAKFFNCTTDYLLGVSDVTSTNITIKEICEYTGLKEYAVNRLHENNGDYLSNIALSFIVANKDFRNSLSMYLFSFICKKLTDSNYKYVKMKHENSYYSRHIWLSALIEGLTNFLKHFEKSFDELTEDKKDIIFLEYLTYNAVLSKDYYDISDDTHEETPDIPFIDFNNDYVVEMEFTDFDYKAMEEYQNRLDETRYAINKINEYKSGKDKK